MIPNQWDGSVQHFYHFLLGYLMPLTLLVDKGTISSVGVRDCGPMNRWFEPIRQLVNLEIMSTGSVLRDFAGKHKRSVVLRPMDDPRTFLTRDLERFTHLYRELVEVPSSQALATTTMILDRTYADPYYNSAASEARQSGAERRSIPNLHQVRERLGSAGNVAMLDASALSPREQVLQFSGTRTLIGQHGAGLANLIWMPRGGLVIEIQPPRQSNTVRIFQDLATACGQRYVVIPQESDHSAVDPDVIAQALLAAKSV